MSSAFDNKKEIEPNLIAYYCRELLKLLDRMKDLTDPMMINYYRSEACLIVKRLLDRNPKLELA